MQKKGLGKGLGALIPGAETETRSDTTEIEIGRVRSNPYQPRASFQDDKFQELVDSVRMHGVLQPIVVRRAHEGGYELVAGERRLRAASMAGLSTIPAVVRDLTDEQSLQVALVENIQREDISPVDAARGYSRLADEFGLKQEDIALALGKSRSAIANTMRLLTLPEDVLEELHAGRISEGHARAILSLESPESQSELCRRVISASLSVRDTERLARQWLDRGQRHAAPENVSRETLHQGKDPNILELESQLRERFATKVSIVKNKERGRIEIEFYSDDDLERILTLLGEF